MDVVVPSAFPTSTICQSFVRDEQSARNCVSAQRIDSLPGRIVERDARRGVVVGRVVVVAVLWDVRIERRAVGEPSRRALKRVTR